MILEFVFPNIYFIFFHLRQIEDGGKAAKSEKMEVGDELVNINGTPLYGSRQEALILIKGSYKILKMIVRRRNVSVVRPHSWHLAKLSEVHPDVASMQYPTDAFSLSWHSGCETSELPMQWNPLSRHCSTDKSSSIGSMESLDQPGQNYYEGTLSPIDPSMYQNKRDSAYSSFSASSNTSDYTVSARTEESSPINCVLRSTKQEDGRYLQTGQSALDPQDDVPSQTLGDHPQQPALCYDANHLDIIKSPPQPPVRRDSLRGSKNQLCHSEKRRASAPGETFYIPGKWSKDFHQLNSSCAQCQRAKDFCTLHQKTNLSSDQYYMLSSQADGAVPNQPPGADTGEKNYCTEPRKRCSANEGDVESNEVVACYTVQKIRETFLKNSSCDPHKPEHNRSSQREGSSSQTVFRNDAKMAASNYCYDTDHCNGDDGIDKKCNRSPLETVQAAIHQNAGVNNCDLKAHHGRSFSRSDGDPKEAPTFQSSESTGGQGSPKSLQVSETGQVENAVPTKKPGSSRHRSAQMRRRSDRFATNLRNEIQNRKAQLQKSMGSSILLCGEAVEERDEPVDCQPRPAPPPPPPKNKARLLEIKKANTELFSHSDGLSQERTESHSLEKIKPFNCVREGINTLRNETVPEDEEVCVAFRNKASNDWWKRSSSCAPHQEAPLYEESYGGNQKPIEHSFDHSSRIVQQPSNMSLQSDTNEWRTTPSSRPSSPDIWERDKGNLVDSSKSNDEPRDPSIRETNNFDKLWRTGSSQNISHNEPPVEAFKKTRPEDTNCFNSRNSFGARANSAHHGKDHHGGERCIGDQRKANRVEDIGLEQKACELRLRELEKIEAKPSKASHQPSGFEEQVSRHKPPGGRWTLSPDPKPQPPYFMKGSPPEVDMNAEEVVPPITRVTETSVLMPFADRRRFFEDSSKGPPSSHISMHMKMNKNTFCSSLSDNSYPQTVAPDVRRLSVDHTCHPLSPGRQESGVPCSEYCMSHAVEPPLCCNPNGHLADYLHSVSCGYRSCVFCSSDVCPALLKRNISMTHHTCHCQHHHHRHHPWTRCNECLCPNQHPSLEEATAMHGDPWHLRQSMLQEASLKEWNQQLKINRKCSQSVSELCQFNSGFHYPGPHKSCCEGSDQERPQCYKAASTYDLSCDPPFRPVDLPSAQDGPPQWGLSRDRSYSVNHLNLEHLKVRERQEPPVVKLEQTEPSARPKKQVPPRPPPPNWEKYKERRSSHESTKSVSGLACAQDVPSVPGYSKNLDEARQRSQSLPMEKTFSHVAPSPPPMQAMDYSTETSEMRSSLNGSPDRSITASPSQDTSNDCPKTSPSPSPHPSDFTSGGAEESEAADESVFGDQPFCSKSSTMEQMSTDNPEKDPPSSLVDIFEGNFHRFEDDWSTDRESEISIPERYEFQPISPPPLYGATSPTSCTSYYNTSAAKADLLNKMKEMPEVQEKGGSMAGAEEDDALTFKKMQLIESISRKLSVLHEAQQGLQEDIAANVTLGCELEGLLKSICKPNEYDKFRSFIGDLDKVVNLLLSLSGRLTRVESALNCGDPGPSMEEKLNLLEKKKQLTDQLEDAQELKAHVTRREQVVLEAVSKYLNEDQLQDYQHYVKMTSALIVEQRELEDKIRLGEEQLRCLRESL
ncbi:protein Shroom4-like isoform X1 [Aquarana catesbeiana]|uniref:protein Shroom4-like isoform X1 n=2 Tax=Aquarana catesbeiana TaxID=8400 RepID=UPI003CC9DFC7